MSQKNINKDKLLEYIRDTCDYCTDYQLPELEFTLNHHGEPDVALFDFTSMFAASNSAYVKEKDGRQLPFNDRQTVYPNGTLVILDVQRKEDAAVYTCVARNDEGYSARSELQVTVMGKNLLG